MRVLEVVRLCDPPDWLVGAGVIRHIVWDYLHGYMEPTPLKDVDVVFFDPDDLTPARDMFVRNQCHTCLSGIPWEATNQAAVHLWYEQTFGYAVPPLQSSADGVGTWPETATSVAIRLLPDNDLWVVAPFGLDDLFQMILRRNPRCVTVDQFRQRLQDKRIQQKWPQVRIIDG